MQNWNQMPASSLAYKQNISTSRQNSYIGAHADRQSRFEFRSARRYGDWFILDVPTPVLWLDTGCVAAAIDQDYEYPVQPVIDIWS